MPRYIAEVIRLRGGNEYREGREGGDIRLYNSIERANEYLTLVNILGFSKSAGRTCPIVGAWKSIYPSFQNIIILCLLPTPFNIA